MTPEPEPSGEPNRYCIQCCVGWISDGSAASEACWVCGQPGSPGNVRWEMYGRANR